MEDQPTNAAEDPHQVLALLLRCKNAQLVPTEVDLVWFIQEASNLANPKVVKATKTVTVEMLLSPLL